MVKKKRLSKRTTFKQKYKVQRKVKEHHKQIRKEMRNNPSARKRLNKDPGVPMLWGLQQSMLDKLPEEKRNALVLKREIEDSRKRKRSEPDQLDRMVKDASRREKQFAQQEALEVRDLGQFNMKDSSKKAFFSEFKKVVKASDVIIEVLDARDPLGSRSVNTERSILALDPNKKIILLLNKIDLAPKENVEAWLKYLRNEYPTLAFKASTQKQKAQIGRKQGKIKNMSEGQLKVSECLGAETLLSLLKNYSRSANIKQSISVGIIGFPNVGKSSIINSLKRARAVAVGARAGVTTTTQQITLSKNIKLIDCPGIIFSDDMSESDAALRNCLNLDQMDDFTLPIQAILNRCTKDQLLMIYSIGPFDGVQDFLRVLALKFGKLGRGGVPDYQVAARKVVEDWNLGKIPYYTIPPEVDPSIHVSAEIVPGWGDQFDLSKVMDIEAKTTLSCLPNDNNDMWVYAKGSKPTIASTASIFNNLADEDEDEGEDEDEDEDGKMKDEGWRKEGITAIGPIKQKASEPSPPKKRRTMSDPSVNPQSNQSIKAQQDKLKKQKRKSSSKQMNQESDKFDFGVDFWGSGSANVKESPGEGEDFDVETNVFRF